MRYIEPGTVIRNRLSSQQFPKWDAVVLCFRDYKGSQEMVRVLNAMPLGYKVLFGMNESNDFPFVHEACIGGKSVGVVTMCTWGGPQAAILVEELAYFGVQYIIGYGAAGSINREYLRGQQVIAGSALPTDGTSRIYTKEILKPDCNIVESAQKAAKRLSCDIKCVVAATVDALYRETDTLVEEWARLGAQIINMESSPFYAASTECGVKSIWIGHISDYLGVKWDDWYTNREEMSNISANICLELLKDLPGN